MMFSGLFASWMLAAAGDTPMVQDPRAANLQFFLVMGTMIVIMYVVYFRPQQKKARQHADLLKVLKARDKIVTSGGIVGEVITVKEKSVTIRSGDAKFEILKSAVSEVTERVDKDKSDKPDKPEKAAATTAS